MIGRLKTPKRFFRRPKPTTSRKKLMSPKQILIVAVRLIVLIGIVQTLSSIVTIFAQSGSEYNSAQLLLPLSIYGFYLAAWLLVWCFPATIANRLLPQHLQTTQETPKHPAPWMTTGIVLIGLYTLSHYINQVPDLKLLPTFYSQACIRLLFLHKNPNLPTQSANRRVGGNHRHKIYRRRQRQPAGNAGRKTRIRN